MLRLRRPLVLATVAGLVLAAVIAFLIVGRDSIDCESYHFDAGRWRAAQAARPIGEEQIPKEAKKIARCGVFTGQPASIVREQLGKPTSGAPDAMSYSLADDPGSGLAWLHFTLDRSRRVVATSVSTM